MTGYVKIIVVSLFYCFFMWSLCGPVEGDLGIYIFIREKKKGFHFLFIFLFFKVGIN